MELSIVRIHKVASSAGQPWVHARPVVQPDKYLSQCPFILLDEENHAPHSEFPIRSREGVIALTLILGGSARHTDDTGVSRQLVPGDAHVCINGRGLSLGRAGELGVRLLHLWINLPASLKAASAVHEVVRHHDARQATLGEASALLYAGTLGASSGAYAGPWPLTIADLSIRPGSSATLPIASVERSFVYVLSGDVEMGRNRVRLQGGSVAWIERALPPAAVAPLAMRAVKEARLLFFSGAVIGEDHAAVGPARS